MVLTCLNHNLSIYNMSFMMSMTKICAFPGLKGVVNEMLTKFPMGHTPNAVLSKISWCALEDRPVSAYFRRFLW